MSLRIRLRVSPRQFPSSAILFEISSDADWPWLAPDFFMFSSWSECGFPATISSEPFPCCLPRHDKRLPDHCSAHLALTADVDDILHGGAASESVPAKFSHGLQDFCAAHRHPPTQRIGRRTSLTRTSASRGNRSR
jgi:hypothetical protein